ncbi:Immunoglobulin-like and fibronectin type III domain-containing protein 1 isoform X11 [Aix galericulata]|nr:Immunoglobulin-like and fibronectin type III domain-containing protein 1 isoform X11 [Aix galericulata]
MGSQVALPSPANTPLCTQPQNRTIPYPSLGRTGGDNVADRRLYEAINSFYQPLDADGKAGLMKYLGAGHAAERDEELEGASWQDVNGALVCALKTALKRPEEHGTRSNQGSVYSRIPPLTVPRVVAILVHDPGAYSALGAASVSRRWVLALAAGGALLDYFIRDACAGNLRGNVTLAQPVLAGSRWQMAQLQQRAGGVSQSVFYYEDQAQAWFPNAQMPESTVLTSLLRNDELSYGLVTSENPPTVKSYKKSSIPGVNIAQFVDRIPEGCSTPDFERKPVTLTLQEELKKKLQDLRKLLRKRAPAPKQKTIDKEAIFQLLLHADRRDYEKICMKYGISDFRGMLRKLQEMRRDAESEQGELIHSIKNMEHIKVNKDGTATFSLEMDLKNSNSKIYVLKDGERLRYGTGDEYRKHYLRRIGKRYNFIVNDVQPEDAGVYQVRVEDVPVFSTELDAESIPVRFQQPLRDVRCPEKGNAVFECILRSPCYDAVWLHKTHPLEASEKHQISITPDGLTHQLVIKDAEASDNGMYTLDTGLCSSNAYLLVEYPKGKKRQDEEGEKEKSGWRKETLTDKDGAKKPKRREHLSDKDHLTDAGIEKDDWYRNGQEGSQGYSADVDEGRIFLGKEGLRKTYRDGTMGPGQFSEAEGDGESMTDDDSDIRLKILGGKKGLRPVHSQDSMTGRANTGDRTGGADELYSVDGRDEGMLDAVDVDMDDAEGTDSWHGKNDKVGDSSSRAGFGGIKKLGATDGSSVLDGLDPDSTRVGDKHSLYGKDDKLGRTRSGKNATGTETAGGMRSPYSKDGLPTVAGVNGAGIKREGETGAPYGMDGLTVRQEDLACRMAQVVSQLEMGLELVQVEVLQEKWGYSMVQMVYQLGQVLATLLQVKWEDSMVNMDNQVNPGLELEIGLELMEPEDKWDHPIKRTVSQMELGLVVLV